MCFYHKARATNMAKPAASGPWGQTSYSYTLLRIETTNPCRTDLNAINYVCKMYLHYITHSQWLAITQACERWWLSLFFVLSRVRARATAHALASYRRYKTKSYIQNHIQLTLNSLTGKCLNVTIRSLYNGVEVSKLCFCITPFSNVSEFYKMPPCTPDSPKPRGHST